MKIVLTDVVTIPEWLYPGSFSDLDTLPTDTLSTSVASPNDFAVLWKLLDPSADTATTLLHQDFDDCGIPHGAPGWVDRLNPELLSKLLEFPSHERWRLARDWAGAVVGRRPNQQRLDQFKKLLKALCGLASRLSSEKVLVILPPGFC